MRLRSFPERFSQSAEHLDGDLNVLIRETLSHGTIDTSFDRRRQLGNPICHVIGPIPLDGYNAHLVPI